MIKKLILAAALSFGASATLADPVEGVWKTKPDDNGDFGYVQIKPCGAMFCGTLIKAFDSSGKVRPSVNIGKKIVWDMVAYPDGLYDDGQIWSPDRDKTYNSDMTLAGDKLSVRGCVIGICRDGGTWSRVK
ncbi:MAG: DUF2147 domain-containing protein [Pseudomonadota bacterium]